MDEQPTKSSRMSSIKRRQDGHHSGLHYHAVQPANMSFKRNMLMIPGYKFNEAKRWDDTGSSTMLATGFNLKTSSHVLAKIAPSHSNSAICLGREVIINNQLSSMPEGTRIALTLVEAFTLPKSAGDCEVVIYLNPGVNALGRYFPFGSINDLLLPWQAQTPTNVKPTLPAVRRNQLPRSLYGLKALDTDTEMNNGDVGTVTSDKEDMPTANDEQEETTAMDAAMDVEHSTANSSTTMLAIPYASRDALDVDSTGTLSHNEAWDVIDLATFLEFAIHSTHCLEILHKSGHKHREVRANAFHVNIHSGAVRFAHFGNRSESLEKTGGPSQLVLRASGLIPSRDEGKGEDGDSSGADEQRRRDDDLPSEGGDLVDTRKVKEAICYLAPEQTGTADTSTEDHRTDLYALGILFWTLLVGHGALPFEGSPVELLHKIVQEKPREVHEIRSSIPAILSAIISKLLEKSPDRRYNSAVGLKNDLMECQKRLQLSCAFAETPGTRIMNDVELIPSFELGQHDMFLELTIPGDLFGREKEVQLIRNVMRNVAANASSAVHSIEANTIITHRSQPSQPDFANLSMTLSNGTSMNSQSNVSLSNVSVGYSNASFGGTAQLPAPILDDSVAKDESGPYPEGGSSRERRQRFSGNLHGDAGVLPSPVRSSTTATANHQHVSSVATSIDPMSPIDSHHADQSINKAHKAIYQDASVGSDSGGSLNGVGVPSTLSHPAFTHPITPQTHSRNSNLANTLSLGSTSSSMSTGFRNNRTPQAHSILIVGPAGIGKSSLIQMHQAYWRRQGLWGHAKMVKGQASPFTGLLTCLSSVLRQLMMFQNERHMFVSLLKARLSGQLHNVSLLYHGVPELRELLAAFGIYLAEPQVLLSMEELGARFQNLLECVYGTLSDVRMLALFLDDIHFADKNTLDLIGLLANSSSRMLILATCRDEDTAVVDRVNHIFSSRARTTRIDLVPLDQESLGDLVSTTLQRSKEDISPLTRLITRVSVGNPFQARNLLQTVWRQGHIWYDWGFNSWQYNLEMIEQTVHAQQLVSAPTDISFLVAHFKELSEDAQNYLIWASIFGPTFKTNDVANMMDSDLNKTEDFDTDDDGSKSYVHASDSEHGVDLHSLPPLSGFGRASMRGLQQALAQGWLTQRARDMCSFTHDKYRQAATHMAGLLPDIVTMKMSLKIASHLMQEPERDIFRITEYSRRCIPLIREDPHREEFIECLVDAAESSAARGAHELALQAFKDARVLLGDASWRDFHDRTKELTLKLAELYGSQGNHDSSDQLIAETLLHANNKEDYAHALRLRSRNRFVRKDFEGAFNDTKQALEALGLELPANVSLEQVDELWDEVKARFLHMGFDEVLHLQRAVNTDTDFKVSIMSDAATNAYWGAPAGMVDYIGLSIVKVAFSEGISPGTSVGMLWALGGAAERHQMHRFCSDLAKLGLQMAAKFGHNVDKCRTETLYIAMVSGYAPEHLRSAIPRAESAITLARSAGDRVFEGFAQCHSLAHRLYCSEHLSDLSTQAEETVSEIRNWTVNSDTNALAMGILMTIRAFAGETQCRNADTAFDTDKWKEAHFLHKLHEASGNFDIVMNWYNSFKVAGLYSLGFYARASELGFEVYKTRALYPGHRHVRYALFFHALAMIQCIRHGSIPQMQQMKYLKQIEINQQYIRAPINNNIWHALIEAELASLQENPEAFKLYDNVVKMAVNHDWVMEEAWALYLEGSHFLRCGVEGLGGELQARGIARHRQWGAYGIVNHLNRTITVNSAPLKRNIFSAEAGVQTDGVQTLDLIQPDVAKEIKETSTKPGQNEASALTAADLADVLKWSQVISSDINLASSLQRLTEIATEHSNAQEATFAMRADEADYNVVTSCTPPQPCVVYEQPKSIRRIGDSLKRVILNHCLNTRSRIFITDISSDPRFAYEAGQSVLKAVICVPFSNNRGELYGALFLGSHFSFSQTHLAIISLLCQQASISIANALLFQSVQQATKANLQMIHSQRQALEDARKSREDAMKATKIKSNFLASMSHELRTPFSSFYGLLDILGSTHLDSNQRELVQTAKQSCELLLKIIDSILDYSKLEASALKLESVPFLVEDVIADCVELLLPLAAQKLDLSYDIAPDVPLWAVGDYSRIRQVLMNLLGNALKFTEKGSVSAVCSVDRSVPCDEGEVVLKWVIQDTGIGMSEADMKNLWQPFSQADNSSTRRFGGTGLGLSISLSLVQLMGGKIGVTSEPDVGSCFWFYIPVKLHESEETSQTEELLSNLGRQLRAPNGLRILVSSPSPVTLSLLKNILSNFEVTSFPTSKLTIEQLTQMAARNIEIDFVILDHFNQQELEEIAKILDAYPSLSSTKAIHLYTPTPFTLPLVGGVVQKPNGQTSPAINGGNIDMALASATGFASTLRQEGKASVFMGRIVRMNKPPRRGRLLQLLAKLKEIPMPAEGFRGTQIQQALESLEAAQNLNNTANVLIAEDNPIANKLLVKQLEKYDIHVFPTGDGSEAVREWERHPIGFFNFALFDHHMPVCDGVEAAKIIRSLEVRRRATVQLPIIALSADCQESTKELCLSAGMTGFLTKPVRAGDLPNLLKTYGTPQATSS
ncbi:hypothetical protein CPB86DRAFT_523058 [Serendipita vermifera]|nr:hypothetical protein CPB86DRAFT_523058 [Serendipita vermifera]